MALNIKIPLEPVAKARARVAFTNGKVRSYTPTKTQEAENALLNYLWKYREKCFERHIPVKLTVVFYRVKSKWMPKKETMPFRKPDLDNFGKLICDAINGLLIVDDSQITTLNLKKRWADNGVGYIKLKLEEDRDETA